MFANDVTDKGLIPNIYKQLRLLSIKKNKKKDNIIKKWAEELNRYFSKEEMQVAYRPMKRCTISLTIREIKIKTTNRYRLTPVRMAIIKKNTNDQRW